MIHFSRKFGISVLRALGTLICCKMDSSSKEFVCVFPNVPYEKLLLQKLTEKGLVVTLEDIRPCLLLKNIFIGLK